MTPATGATMRGGTGFTIDIAVSDLTDELWLERDLVDQLLFALTNQQLLLRTGAVRWLTATDARVRAAVRSLAQCELRRAVVANRLAATLGLPGSAVLADLAASAPPPWDFLLADHCDVLRATSAEIAAIVVENTLMLRAGVRTADVPTNDPSMRAACAVNVYSAALQTLGTVERRSLGDFLG